MTDSGARRPTTDETEPVLIVGNDEHSYIRCFVPNIL